jgi:hypothetical protein
MACHRAQGAVLRERTVIACIHSITAADAVQPCALTLRCATPCCVCAADSVVHSAALDKGTTTFLHS